jgi:DNA-binding FadR family transcriptional regulator
VVSTALRISIQFTNRIKGHTANIEDHATIAQAIADRDPESARQAMRRIIGDVLLLIPAK